MERIDKFDGEFRFLSNFQPAPFFFNFRTWATAEHAYQSSKTREVGDIEWVRSSPSAGVAKRRGGTRGENGRLITVRENWKEIRVAIMRRIVFEKFLQNPDLCAKLLATEDALLVEGNWWRDFFWGVCNGVGENKLGKILMETRDNFKEKH